MGGFSVAFHKHAGPYLTECRVTASVYACNGCLNRGPVKTADAISLWCLGMMPGQHFMPQIQQQQQQHQQHLPLQMQHQASMGQAGTPWFPPPSAGGSGLQGPAPGHYPGMPLQPAPGLHWYIAPPGCIHSQHKGLIPKASTP